MSSNEIGGRIRHIREAAGLNQRDFASRLATSSGYISGVESGKNMPGGEFLLRLYEEFKVDLNWLMTGKDTPGAIPAQEIKPDEAMLLDNYRHSSPEAQAALKATSDAFAQSTKVKQHKKAG